jgi:predicted PurR-regulated permease PerM
MSLLLLLLFILVLFIYVLAEQTSSVTETEQQYKESTQTQATNKDTYKRCNIQLHLMNNIINNINVVAENVCEMIIS